MMTTSNHVWDPLNDSYLMETDEIGAIVAVYTQQPSQYGGLISQQRGAETSYFQQDNLGSTRLLSDESGTVTDTFTYDAWGNAVDRTGNTETPFRWVGAKGYYFDSDLGPYYIRARTFHTTTNLWSSVDPLLLLISPFGLFSSANVKTDFDSPYRYAQNPLTAIDPSGRISLELALNRSTTTADGFFHSLCGAYSGKVRITINAVAGEDYIAIQKVSLFGSITECKGCGKQPPCPDLGPETPLDTFEFYELIGVEFGKKYVTYDTVARTPLSKTNICPSTLGNMWAVHDIRVFSLGGALLEWTGKLGDAWEPTKNDKLVFNGEQVGTGIANKTMPPFWNDAPLLTGGQQSYVYWNCCVDPPTQEANFIGAFGTALTGAVIGDTKPSD